MQRSTGVTISAVLVIAGSAFTILCGALMLLATAFISKSNPAANVPVNLGSILIVETIFVFAFGGWGLSTGIGLLYLKQWSRISLLIYAGILLFFTLPGAVMIAFIPLPTPNDPNLPSNLMASFRIGMVLFYAALAALGGFWLYFFNKRTVKAQFQRMQPAPESAAGDSFLGVAAPAIPDSSESPGARPLSITIIGWYLLVTSAFGGLGLLASASLLSRIQFPLYFLGLFLLGRSAYLIFTLWMAAQLVAAVGLLKLKRWGLFTTIGLQCLTAGNSLLLLCIPKHRAKFHQIMEAMVASMTAGMHQPEPFTFPMWIGYVGVFPVVLVILWFLITRRQAFISGADEVSRQLS